MKRFSLTSLCLLGIIGIATLGSSNLRSAFASDDIVLQSTSSDCGPAALATLLKVYLAIPTTEAEMVKLTKSSPKVGTTLLGLQEAAENKGCQADSFRMDWKTLQAQMASYPLPVIVRTLNPEPHFEVLLAIDGNTVYLADPAIGFVMLSERAFLKRWLMPKINVGYTFVAIGADGTIDQERRTRILDKLRKQERTLQSVPLPSPAFRR